MGTYWTRRKQLVADCLGQRVNQSLMYLSVCRPMYRIKVLTPGEITDHVLGLLHPQSRVGGAIFHFQYLASCR